MDPQRVRQLLQAVREGRTPVEEALEQLATLPYEDLGEARVDHHRALRRGFPEVVFGAGKTAAQIVEIGQALLRAGGGALVTRVDPETARAVTAEVPGLVYRETARALVHRPEGAPAPMPGRGTVAVVTAGTSDVPVAEEASLVLELMGQRTDRLYDAGVAGIHRVVHEVPRLRSASVLIVVAGMEGALPSVVAGLVSRPVIAVPTSVGYGAAFGGVTALLGMLTSCAAGIGVVNIDNGFGAGFLAGLINRIDPPAPPPVGDLPGPGEAPA